MNHRSLRHEARFGMLPTAIAAALVSALVPAVAGAQEADASKSTTTLDRIEVTGSRIRQANLETAQPVVTMSRADIQKQGFTSVADIVQNITASGSPAISRADALSSGEEVGGQYVDLRNLGPERTLVLIDGKRMGISSAGYSDLASIPSSIVERIEVLTDGASALYGSDAIAGVINIITRKRFDGLEASAYLGQYGQGDGNKEIYNFVIGQTGERGSITLGAEYSKEDPVLAKDRSFTRYPNGKGHPVPDLDANGEYRDNGWSNISRNGILVRDSGNLTALPGRGTTGSQADFRAYNPLTDATNTNEQMYLQTGLERRSVFANAEFDITDNLRAKADVLYTDREATQQIAGYPFRSFGFSRYEGDLSLSGQSAFNPFQGENVDYIRRTWEVPRQTKSELTTYRFSAGLEGSFELAGKPWDWDVGYIYNQNKGSKTGTGNLFLPNVAKAVGPSFIDAAGVAHCGSAGAVIANCVPWNPLLGYGQVGPGSLTNNPELQKYLFLPTHDRSETETQVYSLNLSGVLAALPAGDLGLAVGYEHRKESARYEPDALLQSGLSSDLAGAMTEGGYKLDEFYAELSVPVLADVAFAKELSFNIAGRYSDYDTFGDTTNGKFSLKWKPIDDLLIRGTYATGFRAPTVADLYGGTSETFDNYTDPCDTSFGSAVRNPQVAARCAAVVPANFRQAASGGPATGPNAQSNSPFASGSNALLKPETSKSTTVGFVYSPSFVGGLDISLDWWKIKIEDVIAAETVTSLLNNCYVLGIQSACSRFERDSDGQVVDVTRTLINGGYQETAGYDLGVAYRLTDTRFGNFTFNWKTSYVDYLEYKRDNESTTPVEQKTSWAIDGTANFRVRSNFNTDWQYGDFGATWNVRYYSGLKEDCAYDTAGGPECGNPNYTSAYRGQQPVREVGANTFHDVQVRYNTPWNATVALGANNVFDHQGQTMYSQPNSSFVYNGSFDIGRFVYMKYTQRF